MQLCTPEVNWCDIVQTRQTAYRWKALTSKKTIPIALSIFPKNLELAEPQRTQFRTGGSTPNQVPHVRECPCMGRSACARASARACVRCAALRCAALRCAALRCAALRYVRACVRPRACVHVSLRPPMCACVCVCKRMCAQWRRCEAGLFELCLLLSATNMMLVNMLFGTN